MPMSSFIIPDQICRGNYLQEFEELCTRDGVNAVDHGEFQMAVDQLIEAAATVDGRSRAKALALQRCRRGGKTFMLNAVAAMISEDSRLPRGTYVFNISMNSRSPYFSGGDEDAYNAVCSRIAWEMCSRQGPFTSFRNRYSDFGAVDDWLDENNQVILLIDELNVIEHTAPRYHDMTSMIDVFVGRRGCALVYSTHQRESADLLRGRLENSLALSLSRRKHEWLPIPRFANERCLHGFMRDPSEQATLWTAVLRGRVPALLLQEGSNLSEYASQVFEKGPSTPTHVLSLAAVISGELAHLPNGRDVFKAYSYMSECFSQGNPLYAWPPFMVAQQNVLKKDYRRLRATLESPSIDEAKAFEALVQLSVLLRLLTAQSHLLVPHHQEAVVGGSFEATEMFHVAESVTTIRGIVDAITTRFTSQPFVLQVVAVPMLASFPTYDFFVLHRTDKNSWAVAAGYQCKLGSDFPGEGGDALADEVPLSVWIEGKCRKYRVQRDGERVTVKKQRGWILLGESLQTEMLGVSVSEALPRAVEDMNSGFNPRCCAELDYQRQVDASLQTQKKRKAEGDIFLG